MHAIFGIHDIYSIFLYALPENVDTFVYMLSPEVMSLFNERLLSCSILFAISFPRKILYVDMN